MNLRVSALLAIAAVVSTASADDFSKMLQGTQFGRASFGRTPVPCGPVQVTPQKPVKLVSWLQEQEALSQSAPRDGEADQLQVPAAPEEAQSNLPFNKPTLTPDSSLDLTEDSPRSFEALSPEDGELKIEADDSKPIAGESIFEERGNSWAFSAPWSGCGESAAACGEPVRSRRTACCDDDFSAWGFLEPLRATCAAPSCQRRSRSTSHWDQPTACGDIVCGDDILGGKFRCGEDACCDPCGFDDGPGWTLRTGMIFLHRSGPVNRTYFANPANPAQNIRGGNFDFGIQGGLDLSLVAHDVYEDVNIQFRHFSTGRWSDSQSAVIGGPVTIGTSPASTVPGPRVVTADYSSGLTNFEFNTGIDIGSDAFPLMFIFGSRYIDLDESLQGRLRDPGGVAVDQLAAYNVSNRLLGVQLGVDSTFLNSDRITMGSFLRAGVYSNMMRTDARVVALSAPPIGFTANNIERRRMAFAGEIGIDSRLRITEYLNLYGGLRVMYMNNISQAGEQLGATNLGAGRVRITEDDVLLKGATFGLEWVF